MSGYSDKSQIKRWTDRRTRMNTIQVYLMIYFLHINMISDTGEKLSSVPLRTVLKK